MTSLFGAEWYSRGLLLDLTPFIRRDGIELDAFYRASVAAASNSSSTSLTRSMPARRNAAS